MRTRKNSYSSRRMFLFLCVFWLSAITGGCATTSTQIEAVTPTAAAKLTPISFHVVDVGQGDGTILTTSSGQTMVIDTGTRKGGRLLLQELERLNIQGIDLLVLSHPHNDHIGGTRDLLSRFRVEKAWISGFEATTQVHRKTLAALKAANVDVSIVRRSDRMTLTKGVDITVLAPEDPLINRSRSNANANSIVLWIQHGAVDFLLTGDAEHETEKRVLRVLEGMGPEDVEVLKVAHHGSKYASTASFLSRVKPEVAIISCGRNNRYRHPSPETLERLTGAGAKIYRTDIHGTVRIHSNGTSVKVETSMGPEARVYPIKSWGIVVSHSSVPCHNAA
ncbi:MAG: hydrolase [Myxococcales bacterium]|nr:hydrolase [Myxococcales bacterium]